MMEQMKSFESDSIVDVIAIIYDTLFDSFWTMNSVQWNVWNEMVETNDAMWLCDHCKMMHD